MFEEAKFGDKFKSKDGNIAVYLCKSYEREDRPHCHILIRNNLKFLPDDMCHLEYIHCDDNGKISLYETFPYKNIVAPYNE